jgi:hypothetical protein
MAWSTPKTWASGDVLTAADMNTYVRDQFRWVGLGDSTAAPRARVYSSSSFTTATGVGTSLVMNSERFDSNSVHSTVTNTERLTVPSGGDGMYLIGAGISWAANAAGQRNTAILLNNTTQIGLDVRTASAVAITQDVNTLYKLAATDYVAVNVNQNSGGNLVVNAGANYSPELYMAWLSI